MCNTIKGYSVEQLTSFFLSEKYGGMLKQALSEPIRLYLLNKIDCSEARILAHQILQAYECDPLFSDFEWLTLFFDTILSMHHSERNWRDYKKRPSIEMFPALEFVYCGWRKTRRDWNQRWTCAGEACKWKGASKESMVALVKSPIWKKLGDGAGGFENDCLGNPFPPFALGSSMTWLQVEEGKLIEYGIKTPKTKTDPLEEELSDILSQMGPDVIKQLERELG